MARASEGRGYALLIWVILGIVAVGLVLWWAIAVWDIGGQFYGQEEAVGGGPVETEIGE